MLLFFMGSMCLLVPIASDEYTHILAAFCLFEMVIGVYWPTIGTLRSKYIENKVCGGRDMLVVGMHTGSGACMCFAPVPTILAVGSLAMRPARHAGSGDNHEPLPCAAQRVCSVDALQGRRHGAKHCVYFIGSRADHGSGAFTLGAARQGFSCVPGVMIYYGSAHCASLLHQHNYPKWYTPNMCACTKNV